MKFGSRTGIAAATAVVATSLVLTGCSHSKDETTTENGSTQTSSTTAAAPTGSPEALKLLHDAATAMDSVKGVHLLLEVQGKVPNIPVTKLEGDLTNVPQPAAEGTTTLTVGQETRNAKFVYTDGHMYSDVGEPGGKFTDFGDGQSIFDVSNVLDPAKGLANVLNKITDAKVDGTADVDGVATTKVTGTSSTGTIAELGGNRYSGSKDSETMPTTVWIATDGTNHPVKIEINPVPDATMTLNLSDWGKQITVTKPDVE